MAFEKIAHTQTGLPTETYFDGENGLKIIDMDSTKEWYVETDTHIYTFTGPTLTNTTAK